MNSGFTCLVFLFGCLVSFSSSQNGGFSSMLYHIDRNLTQTLRLSKAIDRDIMSRANPTISTNSLYSDIRHYEGAYLMKLALGTPPHEFYAMTDTGSEQTWIQCIPCLKCYEQNSPIFKPVDSSTYKAVLCIDKQIYCPAYHGVQCSNNFCTRSVAYMDGSSSHGLLSTDVLTIQTTSGQPFVVDRYIFGCGHFNQGIFTREQSGMIGIGRGPQSLITQLDKYIHGKFSYCLHPRMHGGKIHFGDDAVIRGHGVVTTPMFSNLEKDETHYFLSLEALTIGNERIEFNKEPGNIIIDSGSTLTHFPTEFYRRVVNSVKRQMSQDLIQDPTKRLEVCFKKESFKPIPITAHFRGADIILRYNNMFARATPEVVCMIIAEGTPTVWGSISQESFLVGFDVRASTVSFKSNAC